jgi:hypothetical protein
MTAGEAPRPGEQQSADGPSKRGGRDHYYYDGDGGEGHHAAAASSLSVRFEAAALADAHAASCWRPPRDPTPHPRVGAVAEMETAVVVPFSSAAAAWPLAAMPALPPLRVVGGGGGGGGAGSAGAAPAAVRFEGARTTPPPAAAADEAKTATTAPSGAVSVFSLHSDARCFTPHPVVAAAHAAEEQQQQESGAATALPQRLSYAQVAASPVKKAGPTPSIFPSAPPPGAGIARPSDVRTEPAPLLGGVAAAAAADPTAADDGRCDTPRPSERLAAASAKAAEMQVLGGGGGGGPAVVVMPLPRAPMQ